MRVKLVVTTEYHTVASPEGVFIDGKYDYDYWAPLHAWFDEVIVFTRATRGPRPVGWRRIDGPGVATVLAPDFVATRGLVAAGPGLARASLRAAREADVCLLHSPGVMASVLAAALLVVRRPYGVEVVGDPRESLRAAGPLLSAARAVAAHELRFQVRRAATSRFVTRQQLQRAYPPAERTPTFTVSDVGIPDVLFEQPLIETREGPTLQLGFVGALQRRYKGADVLLTALARCRHAHTLTVVGDGVLRGELAAQARTLGLDKRVHFAGALPPGSPIYAFMRTVDLLAIPSRTEGLPRVLLEAMAVGVPCLATAVGGVPEVLAPSELVPVDDPAALASAIDAVAEDAPRRRRISAAQREIARGYRLSEARRTFDAFYHALREAARPR